MSAVLVPDGLALAIVPVVLISLVSLIAYLFRQNARSNEALAKTAQQLADISRRTERLEDAVFVARAGN